ncbi:hypothetical protein OIU79_011652 [Salix purpurea]|uniref:SFR19-like C-terminal domain-containing protein n=1 Tax=Salix purpurea TaxID=77065 RepID=A0A9Q0Q1N1_SALPP|nr:hypothetical protein OIU79_011652 [Salix purpurea]
MDKVSVLEQGSPIHSPNSARGVAQIIPSSGGDQYDPFFDSIEPASNSFKRLDHIQKWESIDTDVTPRLSASNKSLDVEEKKKEVRGVAVSTSLENEEFGEIADAEVGDVENQSQSTPVVVNVNMGDVEIDQIKSPRKSKTSKESRSMKLFKATLADFVKEILKPSWRQGNMSKEAFKTIVKKTVDKVAGAMKNNQIPKSKAKIDHYIDSSQQKLTKLVMGYVDKYAKGHNIFHFKDILRRLQNVHPFCNIDHRAVLFKNWSRSFLQSTQPANLSHAHVVCSASRIFQ